MQPPSIVDTRALFRPVSGSLVALLRGLAPDYWMRPTVAGSWVVRDVVAHLLDTTLRRLSFDRDRMTPPPPPQAISSDRDFGAFINGINAQWVGASKRLSPRVLTDLYQRASTELADWFESVPLEAPALFPVSWAGENESAGWFDIGREFTELWHHQQQIRMAVGADDLEDSRYLAALLAIAVRGLPHAYRSVPADSGDTVSLNIGGASGGLWTLARETDRWILWSGEPASPTARIRIDADAAWKLLFNALSPADAARAIQVEGDARLAAGLLGARTIVI